MSAIKTWTFPLLGACIAIITVSLYTGILYIPPTVISSSEYYNTALRYQTTTRKPPLQSRQLDRPEPLSLCERPGRPTLISSQPPGSRSTHRTGSCRPNLQDSRGQREHVRGDSSPTTGTCTIFASYVPSTASRTVPGSQASTPHPLPTACWSKNRRHRFEAGPRRCRRLEVAALYACLRVPGRLSSGVIPPHPLTPIPAGLSTPEYRS